MNKNNFPALFSYEKLTDSEQTSINHILQKLAEYNTMYKQMCSCKEENTKLLDQLEQEKRKNKEAIDYIKNNMLYKYKYDGEELFEVIISEYAKRDLINILGGYDEKN